MGFNDFWINNNGKKEHLNNAKHGVRKEQVDKKFHNLFDAYDANGDGTLESEELGGVFKGLTKFAGADRTLDASENKQVASLFANQAGIEDADFMGFVRSVSKATEDIVDSKTTPTADGGREVTTTYKDGSVETISYYPDGEYKFKKLDQKATTTTNFYTVGDNLNKKYTAAEIEGRVKKAYQQKVAQIKASAEKNKPVEGRAIAIIPDYNQFKQEYMQRNKIYQGSDTKNFERHDFELSERGKQDVAVRDFVLSHYIDTHKAAQEALESMGILDDVGAAINAGAGELWNSIKNVWNGTEEEYQNFYELSKKFEPNYNKALRESGSLDVMRNNPEMFFRGFETDFKKDMGHKYNLENSVQFQQTAEQYQNAQILKQRIDILNKAMQEVRMYQSEQDALVHSPAQNEGLNPASHIVSANKLLLQYFNNDQEAVDMILNGTIGNADATIKAISEIKEDTEKLNASILDGKTFEEIQNDYKSQYKAMYGTDFVPDEMTEKVIDAKATGGMVKLAAITIVSILITKSPVFAEISGAAAGSAEAAGAAANAIRTLVAKYGQTAVQQGIKLAMTSGTLATDVGLTLINQATSERGVNGEELWESAKGSAKYIFFGAYVGAPMAQAVSKSIGKLVGAEKMLEGGVKTANGAIQTTSISGNKLLQNLKNIAPTAGAFATDVAAFTGLEVATEGENLSDALSEQGQMLSKLKVMNHVLEYMLGAKTHTATSRANLDAAIEKSGVKNWNIKEIKTPQKTQYIVDIDGLPVGKFEDANQLATAMLERVTANYNESAKPQTRTQTTKPEGEVKATPETEVTTETARRDALKAELRDGKKVTTSEEINIPAGKFEAPNAKFAETDEAFRSIVTKRSADIKELDKISDIDEFCRKSFELMKEEMGLEDSDIKLEITDKDNYYDHETNTVYISRNWAGKEKGHVKGKGDKAEIFGGMAHELNHYLQWKEIVLNFDSENPNWNNIISYLQQFEGAQKNIEYLIEKYPDNTELKEFFEKAKSYQDNWLNYTDAFDENGKLKTGAEYDKYRNQTVEAESFRRGDIVAEEYRKTVAEKSSKLTDNKNINDVYSELASLVDIKESPLEENHSSSHFNGVQNFNVQNYRKKLSEMKAVQDESMELKPRFTAEEINSLVELKQKYGDIVDRYINQTISANGIEFPIYRTAEEVAKMVELSKAHKMLTSSLSKLTVKTIDDTGKEIEVPRFNSDNIETIIKAWEKNSKLTNELLKNSSTPDGNTYLPLQHPDEILSIVEAHEINPTLTRELMQIKDEHYIGEDGTIHFNLTEQEKALVEKGEHPENLQKISRQKFYGDQIKLLVILNKSNPKITELFKSEHSGNAVQDFSDAYLENKSFIDKLLEEKEQLGVDGLDNSYYVTELAKYRKNSPELADKLLHKTFTLGGETHKMPVAHIIDILKVSNKDNIDVINKALEGYTYRRGLHEQQESRFFADDIVKIAKATTKENKDIVLKALEKRAVYNEIDGYEYNDQHKLSAKTKEVETFAYGADDIVNLARMSEINRAEVLKELGGNKKPVIENWNNDSLKYTDTKEIFIRTLEKQFGEDSDFIALAKESLNNQYFGNDNFKAILDLIDGGDIDVQAQNVHRYICQNIKEANYDRETGYPLHEIPQELRDMVLRNVADAKYDRVTGENIDEKIAEFLQNQRAEKQNIPLSERLVQYKSKIENKLLEDKIQNIIEQFKDDPEFQSDLKDLYTSITDTKGLYKLIHTYDDIKFDRTTGEKISHSEKLRLFKAQIIQDNKLAPSEGVTRFSQAAQTVLKHYNKKDVERLANQKVIDASGNENYKYNSYRQLEQLLEIKAIDENLYNSLRSLECIDENGKTYFPFDNIDLEFINSIAAQNQNGVELAKYISTEVIVDGKQRTIKYNTEELEKICKLTWSHPSDILLNGLKTHNLRISDLEKYSMACQNRDASMINKLLLSGFGIDHTIAITDKYNADFIESMISSIGNVKLSNKLESTKLKISEDQKGIIIGDDIHIRVEDEKGNIYKVDKTTGEVTSLNIGGKTINIKTGETTEVKIVTDKKLEKISEDAPPEYRDVPEYIEVYRSADGKEISHEKMRESKVPGNYEIYSYRKGTDGKITKDLIGLAEYDGNGGVHIEKNVTSLNGTKTQTVYADDVQGNRFSYYRVTDANGKVLYENTEKFKKISDDHYQTFTNDQGYDIQYLKDRVVITKLNKNNQPTNEKIEYTIKDFTEEEYKKFYDELNSKVEEVGEALNNVSSSDIIRTKKDLGKVDIDAILKDQNIKEHTIDRSLIPTLKDLSGEDYFNLFGQAKILVGELSESGNAYSINGGIAVSKEQYGKLSTLLHEAGHEHTARLNLIEDKELNEIYEREKESFVNTFPDEAIETLEYFLANNENFVQNKNNDLIRVKFMKGLDETTAESKLITKYKPQWELTQARTAMLQQYFPETIACIGRKNSANIPTPEVKNQGSQTIKRMVTPDISPKHKTRVLTEGEKIFLDGYTSEQQDVLIKLCNDLDISVPGAMDIVKRFGFDNSEKFEILKTLRSIKLKPSNMMTLEQKGKFKSEIDLNTAINFSFNIKNQEEANTLKILFENNASMGFMRTITPANYKYSRDVDLKVLSDYVKIIGENKNLIENIDIPFVNANYKHISLIKDIVESNPNITEPELRSKLEQRINEGKKVDTILRVNNDTKHFKRDELKDLARSLKGHYLYELDNIDLKYEGIYDDKLKDFIDTKIKECQELTISDNVDYTKIGNTLSLIDYYLNAYHTVNGTYEMDAAYTERARYRSTMQNISPDSKADFTKAENGEIKGSIVEPDVLRDYINEPSIELLRDILEGNRNDEMASHFYAEYYLGRANIPKEIKEKCLNLAKEYGTKVFLTSDLSEAAPYLEFLSDEFAQWKQQSGGQAKYPPVLDFSRIKTDYIDENSAYGQGVAGGYAKSGSTELIAINGIDNGSYKKGVIRHEMTHINDNRNIDSNGNFQHIMPHKTNADGVEVPDFENCKYREEFLKAGIPEWHIKYAYNNPAEFIAVASEGDMSRYSDEFKTLLVDMGMPKWQLNMKTLNEDAKSRADEMNMLINHLKANNVKIDQYDDLVNISKIYERSKELANLVSHELRRQNIPNTPLAIFDMVAKTGNIDIINKPNMDVLKDILKNYDEAKPLNIEFRIPDIRDIGDRDENGERIKIRMKNYTGVNANIDKTKK